MTSKRFDETAARGRYNHLLQPPRKGRQMVNGNANGNADGRLMGKQVGLALNVALDPCPGCGEIAGLIMVQAEATPQRISPLKVAGRVQVEATIKNRKGWKICMACGRHIGLLPHPSGNNAQWVEVPLTEMPRDKAPEPVPFTPAPPPSPV